MLNKLTFKDANLTVDWIGFKFQSLDNFVQTKLAEYLFNIGFNSSQESGKLAKPVNQSNSYLQNESLLIFLKVLRLCEFLGLKTLIMLPFLLVE